MSLSISDLVKKLIQLGENETELNFWLKLFPDLEPDEQKKLIKNLEKEVKDLQNLKK